MPLFIPLGDNNKGRTIVPKVTYALIAINAIIFFAFQSGAAGERFTNAYSLYPFKFVSGHSDAQSLDALEVLYPGATEIIGPVYLTLITSMFLHGGIWHLLGNLLFLWVLGDNIEDEMGHFKFLVFYLTCGVMAGLAHIAMNTDSINSDTPMMGASGAIAGVMGAYLLKHPTRSIYVLLFKIILPLPAWLAVGAWFLLQLFGGLGGFGPDGDGVAYAAHIGGFLAGLVLVNLFANPKVVEDHITRAELVQIYRKEHPQSRGVGF